MNEHEWRSSQMWLDLWWALPRELCSERKVRLFGIASCRRFLHRIQDLRTFQAIEVCERFADGATSSDELAAAYRAARLVSDSDFPPTMPAVYWAAARAAGWLCHSEFIKAGRAVEEAPSVDGYEAVIEAGLHLPTAPPDVYALSRHAGYRNGVVPPSDWGLIWQHEVFQRGEAAGIKIQADILRDIFGNPFRPVAFSPSWRTSAALGLASSMYEARDFAGMPVLADALEEAGCDSADVLAHCRGPGPHVRGCWVVDLVLGNS